MSTEIDSIFCLHYKLDKTTFIYSKSKEMAMSKPLENLKFNMIPLCIFTVIQAKKYR